MEGIIPPVGGANSPQLNMQAQILDAQNQTTQISKLPIGQILTAVVAGNDKSGNIVLRIGGNDLILNSQQHFIKGATLQLKLDSISGSITAQLLTVDGKLPVTQPQQLSNQLSQQDPENLAPQLKFVSVHPQNTVRVEGDAKFNVPTPQVRAEAVTVATGNNTPVQIKGIVINPTPEIMQGVKANLANSDSSKAPSTKLLESLPAEVKAGTQVNIKITNSESAPRPSAPSGDNQKVFADNRTLGKQDWMTKAQIPDQLRQEAHSAEQTKQLLSQLKDFIPTMKQASNGNLQLSALVIDSKHNGEVLVDTKLGKMIINGNQPGGLVDRGTTLTLEITEFLKHDDEPNLKVESKLAELAKSWGGLKEMVHHAESKGVYSMPTKLADAEHALAAKMQRFIEAVKNNDPEEWIGKNFMDSLGDSLGADIIGKLKGDFSMLRSLLTEPNQQGWQTLLFPIFDGKELHQAKLHVKDLPERRKKDEKKTGVRFVMELETTYFGEMQFDGLVRKSSNTHFDLIVRSHKEIEADVKNDIQQIFISASEITGFKGEIQFASMREFPIKPFDELLEADINKHIKHEGFEV
jgi:hypothetical protein